MEIIISGIYDSETVNLMKKNKVRNFIFDFRPKSFNFIQHDRAKSIITDVHTESEKFGIFFGDDPDFMIKNTIEEISQLEEITKENLFLEFQGNHPLSFFDQFSLPYIWHYNGQINYLDLASHPLLKAVIIPYEEIYQYQEEGRNILEFIRPLMELLGEDQKLGISLDWDQVLFESWNEFFSIDIVSLNINQKIESDYQKVDVPLLGSFMDQLRGQLKNME